MAWELERGGSDVIGRRCLLLIGWYVNDLGALRMIKRNPLAAVLYDVCVVHDVSDRPARYSRQAAHAGATHGKWASESLAWLIFRAVADFYRVKFSGGTLGARRTVTTIERAVTAFESNAAVLAKSAKILIHAYEDGMVFVGDPVTDWQTARARLHGAAELEELFAKVRLLRLFKATDALAWGLIDAWDGRESYIDASGTVRRVLANETLTASQHDPAPVSLMSMHRSKGKEFDGVIIAEGIYNARLLDRTWDAERLQANRRLLRVAMTRARHMVVFVRPEDGLSLVGVPASRL